MSACRSLALLVVFALATACGAKKPAEPDHPVVAPLPNLPPPPPPPSLDDIPGREPEDAGASDAGAVDAGPRMI